MEEILASIRRIIADDHGAPLTPRPTKAASAPVIDATASTSPVVQPLSASRAEAPRPRLMTDPLLYAAPRQAQPESAPVVEVAPQRNSEDAGVLAERVARLEAEPLRARPVLRQSFDETHDQEIEAKPNPSTVVGVKPAAKAPEPEPVPSPVEALLSPLTRASVTSAFEALTVSMSVQNTSMVEDAVRDMLKPMLKDWLDNNLPMIVERLVRAEIERVARGGRS
jgi:cell pole-organizing protein PopZ